MKTAKKLLGNNVLYGLDLVICDYLGPVLEKKIGKPFRDYRNLAEKQAIERADATRSLGETVVGKPVELQEELLARPGGVMEVNRAWHTLLGTAAGLKWRELCKLYQCVDAERRDLERMAVACQTAEDSGDPIHSKRVREIMELEKDQAPVWWAGG